MNQDTQYKLKWHDQNNPYADSLKRSLNQKAESFIYGGPLSRSNYQTYGDQVLKRERKSVSAFEEKHEQSLSK